MDSQLVPIIAAAAVMLLVFSAGQIIAGLTSSEKRKLKERLSTDGRSSSSRLDGQRSIVVQQHEQTGLTQILMKVSYLANINRMLLHAYPDMSLASFVTIA